MSTWDPNSELSHFNHSTSVRAQALHSDVLQVIDAAQRVSLQTDGAYDITLAPVIGLWGFGPASVGKADDSLHEQVPTATQVQQALALTGYHHLVRTPGALRKRIPALHVDLSSIAKGFAVDQLGSVLENWGQLNYLVEIGGEIRTRGQNIDQQPWRIGLEHPDGTTELGINANDLHIASSGRYRNQREHGGVEVSHIIDGRTGKPVDHDLVAITVVHDSVMLADAYATALLVLGENAAHQIAEQYNLGIRTTSYVENTFRIQESRLFSLLSKSL